MTDPQLTKETAESIKKILESRLTAGEKLSDELMKSDVQAYLDIEREIFKTDFTVDAECISVPPWERKANQILRDVEDTEFYTPDEIGLARRFVTEAEGWLAWNDTAERWYYWTGTYWENEGGDLRAEKLSQLIRDSLFYERPANMTLEEKRGKDGVKITIRINPEFATCVKQASRIRTQQMVVRAARVDLVAKFDQLNEIPFGNGMFNPETGVLTPHKPENYNTTVCPTNLNLNAVSFPMGEKFMQEISCNDLEWISALFRCLGICLLYGNPYHIFLVCYGNGRNGKGVFFDWLEHTLGNIIGTGSAKEISKINHDGRQTRLFDTISSCRILLFKETGGIQYDEEIIKSMTGEKSITLTRIFTGTKELDICGTPILITNSLPSADKGGISMMRRQIGIPFDCQISEEEEDENLLNKLSTPEGNEWLLCQIVRELSNLRKPNAPKFKASLPSRIRKFTTELTYEADIILQFLDVCCVRMADGKLRTSRNELYQAFCGFAYSPEGRNPTPAYKFRMNQKTFGERLRGYNLVPLEGKQRTSNNMISRYVYQGIALNSDGDEYYRLGEGWC